MHVYCTGSQSTSFEARGAPAKGHGGGGGGGGREGTVVSTLSRVLLSIDKGLLSAASLGIGPSDNPDLDYLSKVRA